MKNKDIKVPFSLDLLMILASLSSWPLCFVITHLFNDETDERKKVLLKHLKTNATVVLVIEIIIGLVYFIKGFIDGFNGVM